MGDERLDEKVARLREETIRRLAIERIRLERRREKLDPEDVLTYIMGPVVCSDPRKETEENPMTRLYAFDLLALEELWEEKGGILVPKEGAGIKKDSKGKIDEWGRNEGLLVRPYLAAISVLSEQPGVLERAVEGTLRLRYHDKPRDEFWAEVFPDSLFDARGLDLVMLSYDLAQRFRGNAKRIEDFYRGLQGHV